MNRYIESLLSFYRPDFPRVIVYMLQATEYQIEPYLKWFWRTNNFSRVMHRRALVMTRPAKMLLMAMRIGMFILFALAVLLVIWQGAVAIPLALAVFLATPILWAHLIVLPLILGRTLIISPTHKMQVQRSRNIFKVHPALKIAVAGSYGKTTMKEMLMTVLSEVKKVAATPANKNVAISHARFAKLLNGDEDILIIEFGEGEPGDVARFTRITKPDVGIITGLAPAHLDKYPNLQSAGEDIFSLAKSLKPKDVYVNGASDAARDFINTGYKTYDSKQAAGWSINNIKVAIDGTSFEMKKGKSSLKIKSRLLGEHQAGPLAMVAALAHKLGLSTEQIENGISKIMPFEHRMEARQVAGAWLLDDTYNGNIDGMKAGLELLKALPGKRKIYITPGLVDQGKETDRIHRELGEAIAKTQPDIVVLMRHSVTPYIEEGLTKGGYNGTLMIEDDPLEFYNNLDHFIAAGDLVMMQNDWPDNYN